MGLLPDDEARPNRSPSQSGTPSLGDGLAGRGGGVVANGDHRHRDAAALGFDVQSRLMIDSVPALIAYIDRDLRYVLANETYRSWFGREPESLPGVLIAEVVGEALTLRLKPFIDRVLRGERQRFEAEFPDGRGGIRLVELDYTPDQPDETGVVPGFVVMANDISERKRLERSLRAGEERWRRLFEGMAEAFFLAEVIRDPGVGRVVDFRFLELNPAFETLTGFSVVETLGKTVRQIHPDVEDDLIRIYARVVETGATERFEIHLESLNGLWFEGTARHVEGPTFSVIFNDVTARKLAEEGLRDRERKQSALVTLGDRLRDLKTVDAITVTAMEILGTTLGAIRAGYGRFVGPGQDRVVIENNWHESWANSLVGEHRLEDYGEMGVRLRNRETVVISDTTTDPISADKVDRWEVLKIGAVINVPIIEGGRLSALFFLHSDVPRAWTKEDLNFVREVADRTWATVERARFAEELAASEERFRQLINVAPQVLWTARPDGSLDYASDQHYLNTGAVKGVDDPANWTAPIHPDDLANSIRAWNQAIETGEPYEVQQRIFDRKSGGHRWHLTRALPIRSGGAITKWLGSNTDIDDQKRSETEAAKALGVAETANRMKDEFLATLSHELRTPLNAIVGWAKILGGGQVDAEDLAEGLDAIERNGQVQSRLIEDLLDVSRIVSGNLRLDVQQLDIVEVINAAIAAVAPAAQAKQIRVVKSLDPAVGPIQGDFARLQQIFWNLAANAVKFTPKGGRVDVALARIGSRVEITVVDTGIGIKPEFLPHVFDRFRQADGSTTRRHGGLGLGLAIVKHLVEMHGGSIRARSSGEDQGSSFTVALPISAVLDQPTARKPNRSQARAGSPDRDARPALEGLRVLVVDDEADARHLIRRVLAECEAEVMLAGSAAEALIQVDRFRPDVLLSDVGMPDEDGYDLIRKIRARFSANEIPAAALTAFARTEDRRRALRAGFQIHLAKPVDPDELIAVVARLSGRTGRNRGTKPPLPDA